MGTGELNAGGNPAMDLHPIQGGVEILLVASCYRNIWNLYYGMLTVSCLKLTLTLAGIAWDYYDGNQDQVTLFFSDSNLL